MFANFFKNNELVAPFINAGFADVVIAAICASEVHVVHVDVLSADVTARVAISVIHIFEWMTVSACGWAFRLDVAVRAVVAVAIFISLVATVVAIFAVHAIVANVASHRIGAIVGLTLPGLGPALQQVTLLTGFAFDNGLFAFVTFSAHAVIAVFVAPVGAIFEINSLVADVATTTPVAVISLPSAQREYVAIGTGFALLEGPLALIAVLTKVKAAVFIGLGTAVPASVAFDALVANIAAYHW